VHINLSRSYLCLQLIRYIADFKKKNEKKPFQKKDDLPRNILDIVVLKFKKYNLHYL
jgi:hypothetical protein